jgi:hypothetical protein
MNYKIIKSIAKFLNFLILVDSEMGVSFIFIRNLWMFLKTLYKGKIPITQRLLEINKNNKHLAYNQHHVFLLLNLYYIHVDQITIYFLIMKLSYSSFILLLIFDKLYQMFFYCIGFGFI